MVVMEEEMVLLLLERALLGDDLSGLEFGANWGWGSRALTHLHPSLPSLLSPVASPSRFPSRGEIIRGEGCRLSSLRDYQAIMFEFLPRVRAGHSTCAVPLGDYHALQGDFVSWSCARCFEKTDCL